VTATSAPAPPGTAPSEPHSSFGPLTQIDAGVLDVGYARAGPSDGPPVVLLHGWRYHIHSFAEVTPSLADHGYRSLVPIVFAGSPLTDGSYRHEQFARRQRLHRTGEAHRR
jgi:pimeloyl-ACP methyl ester carboxylesterase